MLLEINNKIGKKLKLKFHSFYEMTLKNMPQMEINPLQKKIGKKEKKKKIMNFIKALNDQPNKAKSLAYI